MHFNENYEYDEDEEPRIDVGRYGTPSAIITSKEFEEQKKRLQEKHCNKYCYMGTCFVDIDPRNFAYKGKGCICRFGYSGERCEQKHIRMLYSPVKGPPIVESSSHGLDGRNESDENLLSTTFKVSPSCVSFQLHLSLAAVPPALYLFIIVAVAILLTICTYKRITKRRRINSSSWNSSLSSPDYYFSPSLQEESYRLMKYRLLENQFNAQWRFYNPEEITPTFRPPMANISPLNYSAPIAKLSPPSNYCRLNYSDPIRLPTSNITRPLAADNQPNSYEEKKNPPPPPAGSGDAVLH